MNRFTKTVGWAALIYSVLMLSFLLLTGCSRREEAPQDVTQEYFSSRVVESNTILISEVDGCKTYLVTGNVEYVSGDNRYWDRYKTYFTRCERSPDVVNKWSKREGKRTTEESSITIKGNK